MNCFASSSLEDAQYRPSNPSAAGTCRRRGKAWGVWDMERGRTPNFRCPLRDIATGSQMPRQPHPKCILQNVTNIRYYLQFKRPLGNYSKLSKVWLFSSNKLLIYDIVILY